MVIQLSPRQSPQGAPRDRQGAAFGFNKSALVGGEGRGKRLAWVDTNDTKTMKEQHRHDTEGM
jgi:hypothetical protein